MSEAPPPPPAALAALFPPDRTDLATAYADLLATEGVVRGLIGPREAARLWERHLLNCALLAPACPADATVADIGSGAGLPGLVLAIARPDLSVTLIEPLLRRTTFLDEAVTSLGLTNVTVVRGRAEEQRAVYDVVTSRAVAPLDRLLGWSMPLVSAHGALIAMKGASAAEEIESSRPAWTRLGCAPPELQLLTGAADGEEPPPGVDPIRVVRVSWADASRVSLPTSGKRGSSRSRSSRARTTGRKS